MKKIIVNADDFGKSKEINAGVIDAYKNGVVTTASIMTTGKAFDDALRLSKKNPELCVGLHLDLSEFFVIEHGVGKVVDYKDECIVLGVFEAEIREQIKTFKHAGLEFIHLDSHYHIHLREELLDIVVRIAKEEGVKTMRFFPECFFYSGPEMCKLMLETITNRGIKVTDRFVKGFDFDLLENLEDGVTVEVMLHPAKSEENKDAWRYSEWKTATSKSTKDFLKKNNFELISFREL